MKINKLLMFIVFMLVSTIAYAVNVEIDFAFTASTSPDVIGYKIYAKPVGGSFNQGWDVENLVCTNDGECAFTLEADLSYGAYTFAATALNDELESSFSIETELFEVVQPPPPVIKPNPPTRFRTLFQKIIAWLFRIFRMDNRMRIG